MMRSPSPPPADDRTLLADGDAAITVAPADGCRFTSLRVGPYEVLSDGQAPTQHDGLGANLFGWGSFVMAPWAGRIRDGQADWDGRRLELERHGDPHALHGLVHSAPWTRVDDATWQVRISADRWFAPLLVSQTVHLAEDQLRLDLEVSAEDGAAPATVGWHPWFRRTLAEGGPPVELELPARAMYRRDADGIAVPSFASVPDGPFDDAFVDLDGPVTLTWPGQLSLAIDSDAPVTVVFTEPSTVVCVEPQSGPPDEVHHPAPRVVTRDRPLRLSTTWRWDLLG
jgi:aldose 1-epimerase